MRRDPRLSGGHLDALLDALPTDPAQVTEEHMLDVLAALEGVDGLLREQRDDITATAWLTKARCPRRSRR